MTDKQREKSLLLLGTAILHNLANKTWLSGLSTALEALNDPDRSLEGFAHTPPAQSPCPPSWLSRLGWPTL